MERVRKIAVAVLMAVMVFIGSAGTVFALTGVSWSSPPNTILNDSTGEVDKLKTSLLDENAYAFMQDYASGKGKFVVSYNSSNLYFIKFSSSVTLSSFEASGNTIWCKNLTVTAVAFNGATGEPLKKDVRGNACESFLSSTTCSGSQSFVIDKVIDYAFLSSLGLKTPDFPQIWKPVNEGKQPVFYYDDGLSGGGTSSEPDPPTPPFNPNIPEIGKIENEYIPYDTTIWNMFLKYLMNAIGKSTNYGFLILAIALAFWLITRVVHKFTK